VAPVKKGKRWVLRWRLNVCRVTQDLMSAGREFHVCGAAVVYIYKFHKLQL